MLPRAERPRIYADEDFDHASIEALRQRGFDIVSVHSVRAFGESDPEQLARAVALGRVLLTCNRRHFRRIHAEWMAEGRPHAGIVSVPQGGSVARRVMCAALLFDWFGAEGLRSHCVSWIDLQELLHTGERVPGYTEADVQLALGLIEA